jgi:hypothetical protein
LGEVIKVPAASVHRFSTVNVSSDGGVRRSLAAAPRELVDVVFVVGIGARGGKTAHESYRGRSNEASGQRSAQARAPSVST